MHYNCTIAEYAPTASLESFDRISICPNSKGHLLIKWHALLLPSADMMPVCQNRGHNRRITKTLPHYQHGAASPSNAPVRHNYPPKISFCSIWHERTMNQTNLFEGLVGADFVTILPFFWLFHVQVSIKPTTRKWKTWQLHWEATHESFHSEDEEEEFLTETDE